MDDPHFARPDGRLPAQVNGFPVFAPAHQPDHAFRPAQEPLRSTASSIVDSTRATHRAPSICSHRKARICDRSCAPCAFAATSTRSHQESSLRCDLAGEAASISVLCQLLKAHCSRTPQLANRLVQSPLWAPLDCHPWVVNLASGRREIGHGSASRVLDTPLALGC
jgi:hypothetical protein